MSMLESYLGNVTLWFYEDRTPPWIFFEECSDLFRDLYLSSQPNNYCFDKTVHRQLSKCKWRNTVTALRTLVNFSYMPKKQDHSAKVALVNNCSGKFHKCQMKQPFMKSFLS